MEYIDDLQKLLSGLQHKQNGTLDLRITSFNGEITKMEPKTTMVLKIRDPQRLLEILSDLFYQAKRIEYDGTMELAISFKRGQLKEMKQVNKERILYE